MGRPVTSTPWGTRQGPGRPRRNGDGIDGRGGNLNRNAGGWRNVKLTWSCFILIIPHIDWFNGHSAHPETEPQDSIRGAEEMPAPYKVGPGPELNVAAVGGSTNGAKNDDIHIRGRGPGVLTKSTLTRSSPVKTPGLNYNPG